MYYPKIHISECTGIPVCDTAVTWAVSMLFLGGLTVLLLISILVVNSLAYELQIKHMETIPAAASEQEGSSSSRSGLAVKSHRPSWLGG